MQRENEVKQQNFADDKTLNEWPTVWVCVCVCVCVEVGARVSLCMWHTQDTGHTTHDTGLKIPVPTFSNYTLDPEPLYYYWIFILWIVGFDCIAQLNSECIY